MRRKNRADIFAEAATRGDYDEYPILETGIDPQLHVSVNRLPQPFFLICEQDNVLAQLAGKARVEFRNASVNYFDAEPGDLIYMPGGTAHRIVPKEASVHMRYKADEAGLEAVAWYADNGGEISRVVFDNAEELPQEAFWRACTQFNADAAMRTCKTTGAILPPVDLSAFRWRETAADIRASLKEEGAPAPEPGKGRKDRIFAPPPTHTEPARVNVFDYTRAAPTALTPLFPYLGPGCIVPCTTMHDTEYAGPMGYFLHENTVHEVNVCFGARSNYRKAGLVFVGPHHHGVGQKPVPPAQRDANAKSANADRPDMMSISVITQRQSTGKPQHEAVTLVCENCESVLVRHPYNAHDLPETIEGAWNAEILGLPTISQDAWMTERFNADEKQRTCAKCGHVNPKFPTAYWGWSTYSARTRSAIAARNLMVEAAQVALCGAPAAAASAQTAVAEKSATAAPAVAADVIWHEAAREDQLAENSVIEVSIGGKDLAIYRLADGYWATDGICTHAFAQLAFGYLEGGSIECPYHGGSFDIRSGKALTAPCEIDLKTFPVRVEGGRVLAGLPKE